MSTRYVLKPLGDHYGVWDESLHAWVVDVPLYREWAEAIADAWNKDPEAMQENIRRATP